MRVHRSFGRKIPTEKEFAEYVHETNPEIWNALRSDWRCPVCGRLKSELLRWKPSGASGGRWTCSLHLHHDHGNRWRERVLVCGDCNTADGIAKRLLHLPSSWSFSVDELREFVVCEPNGSIEKIDLDVASDIFSESESQDAFRYTPRDPDDDCNFEDLGDDSDDLHPSDKNGDIRVELGSCALFDD